MKNVVGEIQKSYFVENFAIHPTYDETNNEDCVNPKNVHTRVS